MTSIDTVTVTIGGKAPTHVAATGSIQTALDTASPGDLIIVDPGKHSELLLMWKPVRLQGVGAATSLLDANTHPAGKLDLWRRQVNCLFGLSIVALRSPPAPDSGANGDPIPFDPTGPHSVQLPRDRLDKLRRQSHRHPAPRKSPIPRWIGYRSKPLLDGMPRSTATWPSSCRSRP